MAEGGSKQAAKLRPRLSVGIFGGVVLQAKSIRAVVSKTASVVAKIPGIVAYNDLLERILDRGVVLDGESQLAAIGNAGRTHLSATAKSAHLVLTPGAGTKGVSMRRKGAPIAGATILPKD
jgi:hypothetical protein